MFPLAAVSTGLSLVGALQGIFGGNAERKRQEDAMAAAIRDFQGAGEQDYSDTLAGGQWDVLGLRGTLTDALQSGGRGLGSALAGAGVYNSSATAGALANQEAGNQQSLRQYAGGLTDLLARIRNQTRQGVAGMRYGMAQNSLNYARQQQGAGAGGIASFLGGLGQLNMANKGVNAFKPNNTGSVLVPPVDNTMPLRPDPGTQFFGPRLAQPSYSWGSS